METDNNGKKSYISQMNPVVFILSLCWFIFTFTHTEPYDWDFTKEQLVVFYFTKIASFMIIAVSFQAIYNIIKKLIKKNSETIKHTKYFLFYLFLNIFLIYITKPFALSCHDYIRLTYVKAPYAVDYFYSVITNLITILSNNIIPSEYGTPIICGILYSLVFVFVVDTVQKRLSDKYWYIILLLFCLPHAILWNLVQYRQIYAAYMLLFVLTALLRYHNKEVNKTSYSLIFALICTFLTLLRAENLLLFILIPAAAYSLRVFSKKSFVIFVAALLLTASPLYILQQQQSDFYKIHNLAFLYQRFLNKNIPISQYDKHSEDFKNIFPNKDKYDGTKETDKYLFDFEEINIENKQSVSAVQKSLITTAIIHSPELIITHILDIRYRDESLDTVFYNDTENQKNSGIQDYPKKYNILSLILLNNNPNGSIEKKTYGFIAKYFLLNIYLDLLLFIAGAIYAIIKRKKYYIWSFAIISSMLFTVLIFMSMRMYYYIIPMVFNIWAMIYFQIIEILPEYLPQKAAE